MRETDVDVGPLVTDSSTGLQLTELKILTCRHVTSEYLLTDSQCPDYETSVDLWSDIIAMELPCPHVRHLLLALFKGREVRDYPWQVLKHSLGGTFQY